MGDKKEYIERGALIEMLNNKAKTDHEMGLYNHGALTESFIRFVERQPAADVVEVRHGEWVIKTDDYDNEYMMCSCCKDEFYPVDADTVDSTPNYCPNCGAKMDGERKDIP